MNDIQQHIDKLLSIPKANVANTATDIITNKGVISLFVIADTTRNVMYRYATCSAAGNISLHAMSPFNAIDDSPQQESQYSKKTVYTSVNLDPQVNPQDPTKFYNQNLGNYLLVMKPFITHNGKNHPNIYNSLTLHAAIIKPALIPTNIDNPQINIINAPAIKLQQIIAQNNAMEDIDKKEIIELNLLAYQEYLLETKALVEQNLLTYSFILVNPKQNSVGFGLGLDDSMKAMSNPWLNINVLSSIGIPFNRSPILNQYETVVQIVEADDLGILLSDNTNMLGKRTIYRDEAANKSREALSMVAIIKDYSSDIPILLNITDPNGTLTNNNRGRVEAFEALLEKGINTFTVKGSLRPIVRLVNSNAARTGNVFMELIVDTYSVYQSTSMRNSLESDAFGDLMFSETVGDEAVVETLNIADSLVLDNSNSAPVVDGKKGKGNSTVY